MIEHMTLDQKNNELIKLMPHILAFCFLLVYIAIQICAISHPTTQDDIISARVQDIMVMIIAFYFRVNHKDDKLQ